jgi:membrane protease YdiL (CAAX protease family)
LRFFRGRYDDNTRARAQPLDKAAITLPAIIAGFLITAAAGNVWLLLLLNMGVQLAAVIEVIFLALFLWWAHGGGPPRAAQAARVKVFRRSRLTSRQWLWGLIAALFFAATVHASIVLLFRFMPYPAAAFRRGYDLSFILSQPLRWLAVVVSAASAAICEETGFRGFMQQPIEHRHGASVAVFVSSLCFMALHLTKAWASPGIVPTVFGAGVLLGLLAWSARSLIPGIVGHFVMDVGLFAYWWTGIAGNFAARPITETGADRSFLIACCVFATSLVVVLLAIRRLVRAASTDDLTR